MKKLYSMLVLTVFFSLFNNSYAIISNPTLDAAAAVTKPDFKSLKQDVKKLSVAEMEAKLGHKLNWKQKLAMKMPPFGDIRGSFGIGFLLGLTIVGVIVVYVAFKEQPKTIKGAWWGFGVGLLLIWIPLLARALFAAAVI
jgi:hypothetical protein